MVARRSDLLVGAGNALERWRAQLNVTTEQEGAPEEGAAPDGGEQEPEAAAAEYEYLADVEGTQRRDTQAMAPATEDQAAVANLPDPEAGADADETAAQVDFSARSMEGSRFVVYRVETAWLWLIECSALGEVLRSCSLREKLPPPLRLTSRFI